MLEAPGVAPHSHPPESPVPESEESKTDPESSSEAVSPDPPKPFDPAPAASAMSPLAALANAAAKDTPSPGEADSHRSAVMSDQQMRISKLLTQFRGCCRR